MQKVVIAQNVFSLNIPQNFPITHHRTSKLDFVFMTNNWREK